MTAATVALAHSTKLVKMGLSLFRRGFNSSKCKTAAKMAVARMKLLRNKRVVVVKQMRRDIASLLQSGQDAIARIRVEHVIREQNVLAANEIIELFCELIVARLSIIAKRRECPADLKEGIASLIFAAPRCSEISELVAIRDIFEKKYGKDFVSAATDLRPNCGVNRLLVDKLSVRTPTGEVKLKIMKEIAKEYNIEWDTTETETELLKPPEELIVGPRTFVSATSLPLTPAPVQSDEWKMSATRSTSCGERRAMHFEDTASAAEAAAECAEKAIAAAQAAAYLAHQDSGRASGFHNNTNTPNINYGIGTPSPNSNDAFVPKSSPSDFENMARRSEAPGRLCNSQSFGRSQYPGNVEGRNVYRRHSYNAPSAHSDIKFDEPSAHSDIKFDKSDCDEEIEMEEHHQGCYAPPPNRQPPKTPSSHFERDSIHRVHPKLPDYDELTARFDTLKYHKSQK